MGYHANTVLRALELGLRVPKHIHVPWTRAELEATMDEERLLSLVEETVNFPVGETWDNVYGTFAREVLRALLLDLANDPGGPTIVFQSGKAT